MIKKDSRQHSPLRRVFEFIRSSLFQPVVQDRNDPGQGEQRPDETRASVSIKEKHASVESPEVGQQLFVVWDAIGGGRLVGVFDSEKLAKEILTANSHYYRYYRCQFGKPTTDAIEWLDDEGRARLASIMHENSCVAQAAEQETVEISASHIRPADACEIDRMVEIWLSASLKAHNFISSDFWHKNKEEMRQKYLPASENWVYCENNRIIGFFSLQQNNLTALFVAPGSQGRGIGTLLLNKAKNLRQRLSLAVYEKNRSAMSFYCHHGFKVMIAQKDPHTGFSELLMEYP